MKLFKFIFSFLFGIIIFVLLLFVIVVICITGGNNFDVSKTRSTFGDTISESFYNAFQDRKTTNSTELTLKFNETELNAVLTDIICDFAEDYETEDYIYKVSMFEIQKAKIEIDDNKVSLTARAKAAFLSTNFVATGTAEFLSDNDNFRIAITLSKAKLGRISLKNPGKYLNEIDSEYIENGKIILPLNIDDEVMKVMFDNCNPTISLDDNLNLTLDIQNVINEEEKNTIYKTYKEGDMAINTLKNLSLDTTKLIIDKDDFNGFIMVEDYDDFKVDTNTTILKNSYSIKSTNIYLDTINSTLYYGIDLEGVKSYLNLTYDLVSDSEKMTFSITNISLNGIECKNGMTSILNSIAKESKFIVEYTKIEEAFYNKIDISKIDVNADGDFEITCSVLSL